MRTDLAKGRLSGGLSVPALGLRFGSLSWSTSWLQQHCCFHICGVLDMTECLETVRFLRNKPRAELVCLWAQAFGKAAAGGMVEIIRVPTTSLILGSQANTG